MPHVIVKLYPGRTEEQKKRLAEEITRDVVRIAKCEEKAVSVISMNSTSRGSSSSSACGVQGFLWKS